MWAVAAPVASLSRLAKPHGRTSAGAMRRFATFACIDWSGANVARPPGLALAIASGDAAPAIHAPAGGWSRAALLDWLRDVAARGEDMLVGLDLSPALPFVDAGAYFPGWADSPPGPRALWAMVDAMCSDAAHLSVDPFVDHPAIAPYFRRHGGREGALFGGSTGRLRAVEVAQRATRQAQSASTFNLVGAAQVGKSSLTAMRVLHRLAGAIPLWPFDPVPARGPMLVEIYTSIAARAAGVRRGRSKIRDQSALDAALATLGSARATPAKIDDHVTDALVTAAWLRAAAPDAALWSPAALTPHIAVTEGWTFGVV